MFLDKPKLQIYIIVMWVKNVENTKETIRSRTSNKKRQYNCQTKRHKRTNNELQNNTQKAKDWATQTQEHPGGELGCSGRGIVPAQLVVPVMLLLINTRLVVMNVERTRLLLRQTGHITYVWFVQIVLRFIISYLHYIWKYMRYSKFYRPLHSPWLYILAYPGLQRHLVLTRPSSREHFWLVMFHCGHGVSSSKLHSPPSHIFVGFGIPIRSPVI